MKFLFRWAFRLFILALVVGIAIFLLKDAVIKEVVESRIRQKTGMDARIGQLQVGTINPTVYVKDFVLYNTAEFGGAPFLNVPDLYLEYDREELVLKRIHIKLLRVTISELNIVENQHGRTNLQQTLSALDIGGGGVNKNGKSDHPEFAGIDTLNLTVNHVKYTDQENPKLSQDIRSDIKNDVITNIRTEEDVTAVVMKILLRSGITVYHNSPAPSKGSAGKKIKSGP